MKAIKTKLECYKLELLLFILYATLFVVFLDLIF